MGDVSEDNWASGQSYEPFIGRWSRLVAKQFIDWLRRPGGSRWLDVGCGTGALSETILTYADPAAVTGIDLSEEFVQYARSQVRDKRVAFLVGDAQALPHDLSDYDAAVSGLALNFVPDPQRAIAEMKGGLSAGGTLGTYVWDYARGMQMLRHFWDAAVDLAPAAAESDEGKRFPICQPEALQRLFEEAGMDNIEVRAIDITTPFSDFDDYWSPFLGGQGPAPTYVTSLAEDERVRLREAVRRRLPVQPDGSIVMTARAWAAKGTCMD